MTHKNNFNLLRLLLATAVVYSHSFAMVGLHEPTIFGRSLGNFAVHGFFVISGYLISDSFVRLPSITAFSWNRFLRIMPGLVVAIIASRFAADACNKFIGNPIPYISNGPVWTLPWEVICYIGVALFGIMMALTRTAIPPLFIATWLLYLSNIGSTSEFYGAIIPMIMMFIAGIFIRIANDSINLKKTALPALALLLFSFSTETATPAWSFITSNIPFLWGPNFSTEQVAQIAYMASLPFIAIYLGRDFPAPLSLKDDISYGVYIYGWPVAQVIVYLGITKNIEMSAAFVFWTGMLLTAPIAWTSWRLIEKPSMRLKISGHRTVTANKLITPEKA